MNAREIEIAENLDRVRQRIAKACAACGRDPSDVLLVGVAKTRPAEDVIAAVWAGLEDVGENYAQELSAKAQVVLDAGLRPRWHFLGGLQTNKVRLVLPWAGAIHSVDRPSLADEISKRASPERPTNVFIEVNIGGEASKSGVAVAGVEDLCRRVLGLPGMNLVGLMAIPPVEDDPVAARPWFAALRHLRDDLLERLQPPPLLLRNLSMGMSGDFEAAIAEGATVVRVGTAIFGSRK
jgi:pyridoxal phosphate enzyme (YggS family)